MSVLGGYRADGGGQGGVTCWLSQSGPSSLLHLPQKLFIQDTMPLPWPHSPKGGCLLPQHQVLITHSTAVPTVSYLPLCLHSVPEGRSTLSCPWSQSLPTSQYPIPQHFKRLCHPVPHPKNQAVVPGLFRKGVLGRRMLAQRCPQAQERVAVGKVVSAAEHAISGLVVVLLTLPVVLRCRAGLQQGEVCQVELV